MEPFYLEIRAVHIGSALTSGALFLLRALAFNLSGAGWPLAAPVRWLSWTIDTVLLTAALMLMTVVHQDPIRDVWLTTKLSLLVVYVLLGYFALRASSGGRRWACLVGAVLVFGYIYTVARAHHPLGLLA
jgi:uncharacterized membrane protein SirB2